MFITCIIIYFYIFKQVSNEWVLFWQVQNDSYALVFVVTTMVKFGNDELLKIYWNAFSFIVFISNPNKTSGCQRKKTFQTGCSGANKLLEPTPPKGEIGKDCTNLSFHIQPYLSIIIMSFITFYISFIYLPTQPQLVFHCFIQW